MFVALPFNRKQALGMLQINHPLTIIILYRWFGAQHQIRQLHPACDECGPRRTIEKRKYGLTYLHFGLF